MPFNQTDMMLTERPVDAQNAPLTMAVDAPERRVVRQLLEALLFEKIVSFTVKTRDPINQGEPVADPIFDKVFHFALGEYRFRARGTISAFDRVRLAAGTVQYFVSREQQWYEADLWTVSQNLSISETRKQTLYKELKQTLDLSRWNRQHLDHHRVIRRDMHFQQLESAIVEGHLYHPCYKTRTGFSEQDHQRYGSEAGNHFQLLWLAVKKQCVESTLPQQEEIFWQNEIGVNGYQHLEKTLVDGGGSWQDYRLMPIHPWQYQALMPLGLARDIQNKTLIFLGKAGDFYQASQSLRTLINISNPLKANIKLPLNVICTSSYRNLQSHFVHTAPAVSTWLQEIVANDSYLQKQNNTVLLSEYAGLLYEPENNKAMQGCIGAIFRESVLTKLESGQAVVPFSALMLEEADGLPFIYQWLDRYGCETWLKQLFNTMLLPLWHMLAYQGIAFEAHSQNLLLIHRNGWPEKIVLRDFHEDMEFVVDFLKDPDNVPKLTEIDPYFKDIELDTGFSMAHVEALRALLMDTVYIFNLADLGFLLSHFYPVSEAQFWQWVEDQLASYADTVIIDQQRLQQIKAQEQKIAVESLLKKKIMGGGPLDYYEHSVNNPLAGY